MDTDTLIAHAQRHEGELLAHSLAIRALLVSQPLVRSLLNDHLEWFRTQAIYSALPDEAREAFDACLCELLRPGP